MATAFRRRKLLWGLGAVTATAGGVVLAGKPLTRLALATVVDNSAYDRRSVSFEDSAACVLSAQAVDGPFYLADSPLRSDIREGQPGHGLQLRLKLVDANTCQPIVGADVHIWHANAQGLYSGYASHSPDQVELTPRHEPVENEQRFLRGHQLSDARGMVEFRSIVPAWYSFRTPHIHLKALLGPRSVLTTQLYFPDNFNQQLLQAAAPYRDRPAPLVSNRSDPVIRASRGAPGGWLKLTPAADGHLASLTIGLAAALA